MACITPNQEKFDAWLRYYAERMAELSMAELSAQHVKQSDPLDAEIIYEDILDAEVIDG